MSNLIDIQKQIERPKELANEIKVRKFDGTVKDIVAEIQAFRITLRDLQPLKGRSRKGKAAPLKESSEKLGKGKGKGKGGVSVLAKYRGPEGQAWSERGVSPRWLAALVAERRSKEDFAIKADQRY